MALKKCRECGKEVSTKASKCPNCGVYKPVQNNLFLKLFAGFLVAFIFIIWLAPEPRKADRFSTVSLNVRSGPGADYEAISVLEPEEQVFVLRDSLGWIEIQSFKDTTNIGWVSGKYTSDISELSKFKKEQKEIARQQQREVAREEERRREAQRANEWRTKVDNIAAHVMMEGFVEDRLKSPSTAEFPSAWSFDYDANTDYMGSQTYKIRSYVDSQNGFGAMGRTHYFGEIKQTSEDRWRLISLDFLE